jgi:hypothetical protein
MICASLNPLFFMMFSFVVALSRTGRTRNESRRSFVPWYTADVASYYAARGDVEMAVFASQLARISPHTRRRRHPLLALHQRR